MRIKNLNPMMTGIEILNGDGNEESKILLKSDPLPSLEPTPHRSGHLSGKEHSKGSI